MLIAANLEIRCNPKEKDVLKPARRDHFTHP